MGRPKKIGLEYFPIDTCFFTNPKIKALRRDRGSIGISVYLNILCRVYANGYYVKFVSVEELCKDIAEDLLGDRDQMRQIASKVSETLYYMVEQGLIDRSLFEMNVVSSTSMQEQYLSSATAAKRKVIMDVYNLLKPEGVDVGDCIQKGGVSSEETGVSSEEIGVSSEESAQSKSKSKSKSKDITLYYSATDKKGYGKHDNIMLTEAEYLDLSQKVPKNYLDRFSEKLRDNGYKYDDHYQALMQWWEKDKQQYFLKRNKRDGFSFQTFDGAEFFASALEKSYRGVNAKD